MLPAAPLFEIPLNGAGREPLQLEQDGEFVSLVVSNVSLREVVTVLAKTQGFNLVTVGDVDAPLTNSLERVRWSEAFDSILTAAGFTWFRRNNIIHMARLIDAAQLSPDLNGRQMELFELDFVSAEDVNSVVSGMLSPIGRVNVIVSEDADNRRTREMLAVEDLPVYLNRIREQVALIELSPRQVLIEAHLLQVDLSDDTRHGINFQHAFRSTGNILEIETTGFANASAAQAFFLNVRGGNLTGILENLKATNRCQDSCGAQDSLHQRPNSPYPDRRTARVPCDDDHGDQYDRERRVRDLRPNAHHDMAITTNTRSHFARAIPSWY